MNKFLNKILKEITDIENINYKIISDGFIIVLEKNNEIHYLNEFRFGLNSQIAATLCDDKYAMCEVLKYHNIPVIDYRLIWDAGIPKTNLEITKKVEYLKEYYKKNNNHIVLKPNNGYSGKLIFNIENEKDIESSLIELLKYTNSIVVNPFYKIKNEHRVIILNGKCRLVYTKNLNKNEWQFNLSKGSIATKIKDTKLKEKLINLAINTYNSINAKFISVDIIKDYNGNLKILEVNSGVCMEKYCLQHPEDYELVKEIYYDAIKELFDMI